MNQNLMTRVFKKSDVFYFLYTLINNLVIQSLWILSPIVMGVIIDKDLPKNDVSTTLFHIVVLCSIPLVAIILGALHQKIFIKRVWEIALTVKEKVFEGIVHQPVHFFKTAKQSDLQNACATDLTSFVLFYLSDLPSFIAQGIITLAVLYYLSTINVVLLAICLISLPFIVYPGKALIKHVMHLSQNVFKWNRASQGLVNESFSKNRLIKIYTLEDQRVNELRDINHSLSSEWTKITFLDFIAGNWSEQLVYPFFFAISFSYAVWLYKMGLMSIGEIIVFLGIMPRLYSTIGSIIKSNLKVGQRHKEFENLNQYLDLYESIENNNNTSTVDFSNKPEAHIEFRKVSFKYPDSEENLLEQVNFSIKRGLIHFLKGANGTGKSTLFDLMIKCYDPTQGEIYVNGVNLKSINDKDLRREILLVSQQAFIFSCSIRDNFMIAQPEIDDELIWELLDEVGLKNHLASCKEGLDLLISDANDNLSGGQRQRLALAIAFARNSRVLLLDEIDSNIDLASEHLIYRAIENRAIKDGVTIVIISHKASLDIEVHEMIELSN